MENGFTILKAVKKSTYNEVIHQANLKIIPSVSPEKKYKIHRSQSNKMINNFVPLLKPKKSAFIPTPLLLDNKEENSNINKKNNKKIKNNDYKTDVIHEKDEKDSSNYNSSSSSPSSSSLSSSNINSSGEESGDEDKKEKKEKIVSNDSMDLSDDDDDFLENNNKRNIKGGHIKNEDTKMLKMKVPFKKDQKGIENSDKEDVNNTPEKKAEIKPKIKSILEVISLSKKAIQK